MAKSANNVTIFNEADFYSALDVCHKLMLHFNPTYKDRPDAYTPLDTSWKTTRFAVNACPCGTHLNQKCVDYTYCKTHPETADTCKKFLHYVSVKPKRGDK